jgi:cytochrome c556
MQTLRRKMTSVTTLTAAVLIVTIAGLALAQGVSAADTVKARQQGLKALGAAFKVIRDELRGGTPDAEKVHAAAAEIAKAASAISGWFPQGSGPETGVKTDAKREIWSDAAGFASARDAFVQEAGRATTQFAGASSQSAWGEAAAALGQTCKECHDKYRVKRD